MGHKLAGVETAAVRVDKFKPGSSARLILTWFLQFSQDGMVAHIAAHSRLDRALSGLNCSVPTSQRRRHPFARFIFYFLKARRAVMGPAKRGPIWAG